MLALYKDTNPTNCKIYPKKFNRGIAIVRGIENDDKIEVIVEMYIELQAPPEHIVKGAESEDKIFNKTDFTTDGESFF